MSADRVLIPRGRSFYANNILDVEEDVEQFYDDNYYTRAQKLSKRIDVSKKHRFYFRVFKLCKIQVKQLKCLDIGTGSGAFPAFIAERGGIAYGIDISSEAISLACQYYSSPKYIRHEAESLPFESGEFDFITFFGTLEHFENMEASLQEARRVLRKDGKVFILVPNLMSYTNILKVWMKSGTIGTDQILELLGTKKEWAGLFRSQGYKIEKVVGHSNIGSKSCTLVKIIRKFIGLVLPQCYQEVFYFVLSKQ